MATRRGQSTPNMGLMGKALSRPGMDPRVWTCNGRTDYEDAARWDADIGWVVDVNATSAELVGETMMCRVAAGHPGEFIPIENDQNVVVSVPGGHTDGAPAIVGLLNNQDGNEAPGEVNGLEIDGSTETSPASWDASSGAISPYDTEVKVSKYNRREEFAGDRVVSAQNQVLEGEQIRLAERDASEPFIKGNAHSDSLNALVDALNDYVTAIGPIVDPPTPPAPVGPSTAKMLAAITEFKLKLVEGADLSSRIKGE